MKHAIVEPKHLFFNCIPYAIPFHMLISFPNPKICRTQAKPQDRNRPAQSKAKQSRVSILWCCMSRVCVRVCVFVQISCNAQLAMPSSGQASSQLLTSKHHRKCHQIILLLPGPGPGPGPVPARVDIFAARSLSMHACYPVKSPVYPRHAYACLKRSNRYRQNVSSSCIAEVWSRELE
jgi:hypothetical protein